MDCSGKSLPNVGPPNSSSTNYYVDKISKDCTRRLSISVVSPASHSRYNERRASYLTKIPKNLSTNLITNDNASVNLNSNICVETFRTTPPSCYIDSKSKLSNTRVHRFLSKVKNHERRSSYVPRNWIRKKSKDVSVQSIDSNDTASTVPCDLPVKFEMTTIQRLIFEMKTSVRALQLNNVSNTDLEDWALIIYESMSAPSRTFHSVQHVFDISEGADPISKLAAFFHDVIYYSIDGGLVNDRVEELIGNVFVVDTSDEKVQIYITNDELDANTKMVMEIFGFKPGQILDPFKGMNEFLSAVLAVRCYQKVLSNVYLAQIAACIEATIPFRKVDNDGKTPCDLLYDRLLDVNEKFQLGLNDKELVKTVQRAAYLNNRDLDNFSSDRAVFLSNTWNLLPESNITFRNTKVLRISDYAMALKKMTGFFEFLDPNTIYFSFRDDNNKEKKAMHKKKTKMAKLNIQVATKYMHCKLLSIGVVAAISELSGGDAPLALFLGDLPGRDTSSISIEDFMETPNGPINDKISTDSSVFDLLRYGRESETKFDIKNSPLAAYLYALIGDEGVEKCLVHAVCPMDEVNAKALLRAIPKIALATIVAACAELATTRVERFDEIMDELT